MIYLSPNPNDAKNNAKWGTTAVKFVATAGLGKVFGAVGYAEKTATVGKPLAEKLASAAGQLATSGGAKNLARRAVVKAGKAAKGAAVGSTRQAAMTPGDTAALAATVTTAAAAKLAGNGGAGITPALAEEAGAASSTATHGEARADQSNTALHFADTVKTRRSHLAELKSKHPSGASASTHDDARNQQIPVAKPPEPHNLGRRQYNPQTLAI